MGGVVAKVCCNEQDENPGNEVKAPRERTEADFRIIEKS